MPKTYTIAAGYFNSAEHFVEESEKHLTKLYGEFKEFIHSFHNGVYTTVGLKEGEDRTQIADRAAGSTPIKPLRNPANVLRTAKKPAAKKEGEGFTLDAARAAGYAEEAVKGMAEKYGVPYAAPVPTTAFIPPAPVTEANAGDPIPAGTVVPTVPAPEAPAVPPATSEVNASASAPVIPAEDADKVNDAGTPDA